MKSEQLSFGPQCVEFEKQFAHWQGRKHAIFVNSGSSANLALIQTLINTGLLKHGDAIAFSALTWATNVMPIIELGLKPVPIDVEIDSLNVSSRTLREIIESTEIKALFITNLLGLCDDLLEIKNLCARKNILLLEDNCESLGSVHENIRLGNFGLASTFSFFVGHHMSTIEGGMVCTDDDKLAMMLRLVRAHGWDRNLDEESKKVIRNSESTESDFYGKYTFYHLAFNLRPTEINGFIGLTQLPYLDTIVARREANFKKIARVINTLHDLYYPLRFNHMNVFSCFATPLICKTTAIRDALIKKCSGQVEIRPIVGGNMTHQPFFKRYSTEYDEQENATRIHNQGLYFSNDAELNDDEIETLMHIFKEV
jgi:CDP-6-deoxy-D-xylo-4-hexulose-3-dehydrase